jgi:hypothetical protein
MTTESKSSTNIDHNDANAVVSSFREIAQKLKRRIPRGVDLLDCVTTSGWYSTTDGGSAYVKVYRHRRVGAMTNRVTGYLPPGFPPPNFHWPEVEGHP